MVDHMVSKCNFVGKVFLDSINPVLHIGMADILNNKM